MEPEGRVQTQVEQRLDCAQSPKATCGFVTALQIFLIFIISKTFCAAIKLSLCFLGKNSAKAAEMIQMRLTNIIEKERIQIEKLLIPSNGGLRQMTPNPFKALGIQQLELEEYVDEKTGIKILQKRGEDIPELCVYYTAKEIPVFGLTGDDLFDEYQLGNDTELRLVDTIDWIIKKPGRYKKPTLCLIGIKGGVFGNFPKSPRVVVNNKYPLTANQYIKTLEADFGVKFNEVRYLSGKTESEIPGQADFVIDIVVSGRTLKYVDEESKVPRIPQLTVLDEIRQSDMSVITSWPRPNKMLDQYKTIEQRQDSPTDSLTSKLLQDENKLIKKIGEENAELVRAIVKVDFANYLEEMQQAVWLMQVAAVKLKIPQQEFFKRMADYKK
jgi:phosphoribosyl-ATP pyrophosphohydrolase